MKKRREAPTVQDIGDVMLTRECEASPHCRRLQLKDLLVSEMQRLTKYPLLLDNIIKHTEAGSSDLPSLQRAHACCRGILLAVNEDVRETEHRQRLSQYQRRLDAAPLFKSLDLTTKRMIHEGPLTWKVNKDKQIDPGAAAVGLPGAPAAGPDGPTAAQVSVPLAGGGRGGSGDSKTFFSPLVKLDSLLVRSVATDNKALYLISTTERQIYELVAGTASEKNTSSSLRSASPVSTSSNVFADNSITEQSDSMETHSSNDDIVLSAHTPTDQSEAFICGEGEAVGVAEAALQDVETLRQLILRDLDEDGWSHNSDDTPTNETTNERSLFTERQRPESLETVLNFSTDEWEAEPEEEAPPIDAEQPSSVQVVRKAQGESATDDLHDLNNPPTPTTSHFPQPLEEVISPQPEEEAPACFSNQSEAMQLEQEEETGQSPQSHVIKNVDEIFHTIEGLTSKLRQLKDIENSHHTLLKTLREPLVNQESEDQQCPSATVSRTPSLDRGSGDAGKEGSAAEPKIQSTGF
ncbi:hypothetical protein F7725_004699 [Dissostichus mawsoni]|uniref:DH domain-containing protein n=1 Tax=Dissostichus mawsoni TaxID=36200 RepID=A0A7J5XJI3_DISMA|nr:hypothetical protein F7725_004699 [Dissostichus mawsoni]